MAQHTNNQFTLHIKSNDQQDHFPDNTRNQFEVDLIEDYKLNPNKSYFAYLNNISVNDDINGVKLVCERDSSQHVGIAYTQFYINHTAIIGPDFDNFKTRMLIAYGFEGYDFKDDNDGTWIKYEKFPQDPIVLRKTRSFTCNTDTFKAVLKIGFPFGPQQLDTHTLVTMKCVFPVPHIEVDHKDHGKKRASVYVDVDAIEKFLKKLRTSARLTRILNIATDNEGREVSIVLHRSINYVELTLPMSITRLLNIHAVETVNGVDEEKYLDPLILREKKVLSKDANEDVDASIEDVDDSVINNNIDRYTFYPNSCSLPTTTLQHFCVELNISENNTISTTARSILKLCPINEPSTSKTKYQYINALTKIPEYLAITKQHIRRLKFRITDINGELISFRHNEESQKDFPTIISLTIVSI
jgi:hypothetical protein